MRRSALVALFISVLALAGCGGSDGPGVLPPPEAARVAQANCSGTNPSGQALPDGSCVRTSGALGAPLAALTGTPTVTITPAQLMDWAEQTYPELFPAAGKTDGYSAPYTYRFYPQTSNYIGVSTGDADVAIYLYGNISAWNIVRIGPLNDFACKVTPAACETRALGISQFGSGSVIAADGQPVCTGKNCSRDYPKGTALTLTATPAIDWKFRYWSGCDTVTTNVCKLTLGSDRTVHPVFERVAPPVLKSDVVQLSAATMRRLVSSQGSVLIFNSSATQIASLTAGKIIYSTVGEGLLRRVVSVISLAGGNYIVDTTDATLTDLIAQGTLIMDGRTPTTALRLDGPQRALSSSITVDLTDPSHDGLTAKATVEWQPEAALDIDLTGINELKVIVNPKLTLSDIQVRLKEKIFPDKEIPLGSWVLAPIVVGPVVLVPTLDAIIRFKANIKVGVEINGQMGGSGSTGFHYTREDGMRGVGTFSMDGSFIAPDPLKAKGTGEFDALIGFKAGLKVLGRAGPVITVGPFLNAKGSDTISQTEACIRWTVKGGVKADAKAEFKIFSFALATADMILLEKSWILLDGSALKCEDKEKPSTVASGSVEALSPTQLRVTWAPATDNVAVVGYAVVRGTQGVATEASTSYIDNGLSPDTEYCYTVAALDKAGNRALESPPLCGRTKTKDAEAPDVPGGLTATPLSSTSIRLGWTAPTDTGGIAGYVVYQDGKVIGQISGASLDFIVTKLKPGISYCFQVAAIDSSGNVGLPSTTTCAMTLASAAWTMKIKCDWSTFYAIEKDVDLDIGNDQTLDVVGSGTDYNGVALAYQLYGNYSAATTSLTARISWTFAGSSGVRSDEFTAGFNTNDTGDIAMNQVQVTGCDAFIRFVRKGTTALAAPLAYPRQGTSGSPFMQR